jgi:hypothetical protein
MRDRTPQATAALSGECRKHIHKHLPTISCEDIAGLPRDKRRLAVKIARLQRLWQQLPREKSIAREVLFVDQMNDLVTTFLAEVAGKLVPSIPDEHTEQELCDQLDAILELVTDG